MPAFKDEVKQFLYETCRKHGNDPNSSFYTDGYPNTLSAQRDAYFKGRRGNSAVGIRSSSLEYVCWRAGSDDRKQDIKNGKPLMPPWSRRPKKWLPQ